MVESLRFPDKWLKELNLDLKGRPRSMAIFGASILDSKLTEVLKEYFFPPIKSKNDQLLGRSGILESFGSKIEISYRLGLIDIKTKKSLNWIRDIRNDAAHEISFSFNSNRCNDLVNNIVENLNIESKAPKLFAPPYSGSKGKFSSCIIVLSLILDYSKENNIPKKVIPSNFIDTVNPYV